MVHPKDFELVIFYKSISIFMLNYVTRDHLLNEIKWTRNHDFIQDDPPKIEKRFIDLETSGAAKSWKQMIVKYDLQTKQAIPDPNLNLTSFENLLSGK